MTSPQSEPPRLAPAEPDLVWFSGADARRFLNDLISQEIGDLEPGTVRRSLLLGPQGKLAFLLKVFVDDERIGLLTDPGRGEELATALGRYRIRVDVDIEIDVQDRWVIVGDCEGVDISWPTLSRCLVFGQRPELESIDPVEYEQKRVAAGVPAWGRDVDENTIPHETGLVPLSVDFEKGCFLGQELVARIDSRGGNVPRHLSHVELDDTVEPGSVVTAGEKDVGTLTSVAPRLGLGLLHRDVGPGDLVTVGSTSGVVKRIPIETTQ